MKDEQRTKEERWEDVNLKKRQRTNAQNRALHKYFSLLSDELNKQGHTITEVLSCLKVGVELSITPMVIKDIWKAYQKALYGKESTTELNKSDQEIKTIHDNIDLFTSQNFSIHIPFPNYKNESDEDLIKNN
jgi:hypothetical protein